jgi:hypothetical protein
MKFLMTTTVATLLVTATFNTFGYEINNHADMTQEAANISLLQANTYAKLKKLGLKALDIADPAQTGEAHFSGRHGLA